MTISHDCEACGATVAGAGMEEFADAFLAHVRADHADWPYPDVAVRNYAEATQRLTGSTERLATLGEVAVHPVTPDRIDDWLSFFDHDAFAGYPQWAACYCSEPHVLDPASQEPAENRTWQRNRETMIEFLQSGKSFGYLAYVAGRPAGWVNASLRVNYALFRRGESADPPDGDVVGVSCFIIAPPYRRHGLAATLLDRVLADAAGRGVHWVEAYPFNAERADDAGNFRGPRSLYDERGFEAIKERARDTVVRRSV